MENVRHYFPKKRFGPADWRRMIYMVKVRQEKEATFGVFDCPDMTQTIPIRSRSTTPLQALNLLNSGFVLQQADMFGKRLRREGGSRPEGQVRHAFQLAFGRDPEAEEAGAATRLIRGHGLHTFCRALFNANEFLFLP